MKSKKIYFVRKGFVYDRFSRSNVPKVLSHNGT